MTRQRQIIVTVTYNDLGCIIDTKTEPYEEPNLQPTCNQLATVAKDICVPCKDSISRQAAIDAIEDLPSAQSDIIKCNACKHWTQTTGNMPGFGLGDCDYLNAKLVSCNGFCYWAERRTDE